jgi:nucleotide-binding universal stress UspA family protein
MELLTVVVIVLLVVGLLLWGVRSMRAPGPRPPTPGEWHPGEPRSERVTLDLTAEDPDHPAVQRLVDDAARRALRTNAELESVEVLDREGRLLGRMVRPGPLPPPADIPDDLHEPHATRDHTPQVVRGEESPGPARPLPEPDPGMDLSVPGRPLAEQFDLPTSVRRRVRDPERAVDVVRAILEAAGRPVHVDREVIVTGDTAIAVVAPTNHPVADDLAQAFMRIQATRAARGVVVRLGYADPALIRQREAAAPHVRHVTADGIQRMADAVEAGGDPVEFAVGPVVLR